MSTSRRQLVLCVGPRCNARADLRTLLDAALALAEQQPDAWSVGTYACLGRCPTGPNACVRRLSSGDDPHDSPGYRDLDDCQPLSNLDTRRLRALLSQDG